MALGNKIKIEDVRISRVPCDVSKTIKPGDLLKWSETTRLASPTEVGDAGSATVAATVVGVSNDQQPIASLGSNLPFGQLNVIHKGLVEFTIDDNATYLPGDYVTLGGGPQLVKKTGASANNAVGVVAAENHFDAASGSPAGIVAVQGATKLLIWLKPQYIKLSSL